MESTSSHQPPTTLYAKYNHLNLKDKFKLLIGVSTLIVLLLAVIGLWRYGQFRNHKSLIQSSSQLLLSELKDNFSNSQLMGEIQTDLTSFMQTAHPGTMRGLMAKTQQLSTKLPTETKPLLLEFANEVGILEIRMSSLRKNNATALIKGNNILQTLEKIDTCRGNKQCTEGIAVSARIYRTIQPFYIDGILGSQEEQLILARKGIDDAITKLGKDLHGRLKSLPQEQADYITKVLNLFYDLDDAISTVAAIRQKVLDSGDEVLDKSRAIKSQLATLSIKQGHKAVDLADKGLELATSYVVLMFISLVTVTILFMILSLFLSRSILRPLVVLVDMLKQFTDFLASVRLQNVVGEDNFKPVYSQITKRHDEIGDVGRATKNLIDNIQSISEFRRKIEDDTTIQEVYFRLAKVFKKDLKLNSFVFYERASDNSLPIVYCEPHDICEMLPELTDSSMCRAKRTGLTVSSFADPDICQSCPVNDVLDYFCVPMLVGGNSIGVIQFFLSISTSDEQKKALQLSLHEARKYIAEALPVLQAKRFANRLEEMATKDQLTGLYNRRYLDISLQQIVAGTKRRNARMGVLMCDMDFFKHVNDTYGHDSGDIVLSELAHILTDAVRESDLVVRFGGEEFLILLADITEDSAEMIGEKIRSKVEEYVFRLPGAEIKKTLSIGVSEFPDPASHKGIWEIIKFADVALYNAKEGGRNKVVKFDRAMWKEQSF